MLEFEDIQLESEKKIREKEINKYLNLSIEDKEELSLNRIREFIKLYPEDTKFKIAFSGGRDSTLMLYLIEKVLSKERFFLSISPEMFYPENIKFINEIINKGYEVIWVKQKMGFIEVINKLGVFYSGKIFMNGCVAMINKINGKVFKNKEMEEKRIRFFMKYSRNLLFLLDEDFRDYKITCKCCQMIKLSKDKNTSPTFLGLRIEEGNQRRNGWIKTGCIDYKNNVCKPISFWNLSDEKQYIEDNNIAISEAYKWVERTGCILCPFGIKKRIKLIYEKYPNIYNIIKNSDLIKIFCDCGVKNELDKEYMEFYKERRERLKNWVPNDKMKAYFKKWGYEI